MTTKLCTASKNCTSGKPSGGSREASTGVHIAVVNRIVFTNGIKPEYTSQKHANKTEGEETLLGYILSDSYIKPSPRTPDIQRHEEP
jgi:hypothetical protein